MRRRTRPATQTVGGGGGRRIGTQLPDARWERVLASVLERYLPSAGHRYEYYTSPVPEDPLLLTSENSILLGTSVNKGQKEGPEL